MSFLLIGAAVKAIQNKKKGKKTNPFDILSAVAGLPGVVIHEFAKMPKGSDKAAKKQNIGNFISRLTERVVAPGFTEVIDIAENKSGDEYTAGERWNIIASPVKHIEYKNEKEVARQYAEYEKELDEEFNRIQEGGGSSSAENVQAGFGSFGSVGKYALPLVSLLLVYKVFSK